MLMSEMLESQIKEAVAQAFRDTGRQGGLIGGKARAAKLSKRRRSEIARKAGIASGAARARKARERGREDALYEQGRAIASKVLRKALEDSNA